jgi:CDK inhibitor PHO81
MTVSSLRGNYVYVVVQVTRDFHPVIFADWRLPETGFDLGVSDVTLAQFEALARRVGRNLDLTSLPTATDLHALMSHSMLSLAQLMKVRQYIFCSIGCTRRG